MKSGAIKEIDQSDALTRDEKADYKSDIQTTASQIGKSKPSRIIIKTAWKGVKALADVEGFAQLIGRLLLSFKGSSRRGVLLAFRHQIQNRTIKILLY